MTLFLLLLSTAGLLGWCAARRMTGSTPWLAHVLTLVPAVLMSLVLLQAGESSERDESQAPPAWRVTLGGLQFRLPPGRSIRLGGDPQTDHLYVRGMPPGLLTL